MPQAKFCYNEPIELGDLIIQRQGQLLQSLLTIKTENKSEKQQGLSKDLTE